MWKEGGESIKATSFWERWEEREEESELTRLMKSEKEREVWVEESMRTEEEGEKLVFE